MEFKATFEEEKKLKACFKSEGDFKSSFGSTQVIETGDYEKLTNKPKIEGHTLVGDKTFPELGLDTLAEWEIEKILYID